MIEASYSPGDLERKWYAQWLENNLFAGKISPHKKPYCIAMPPPNVTGILHMGHILNNTIQDVLIRRARQKNKSAFWIPGTDHAGISLQVKVKKEIIKEGKRPEEVDREYFLERAKDWREKQGNIILEQLKKLGVSCDWSAIKYTQDPDYSRAVLSTFVKLYEQGHIYRGLRFVNWCPATMTALSDEEVIMRQQESFIYHVKYELVERSGEFISVATTRPETIMGDVAIAVHPSDGRYAELKGLHCWRPILRKQIPIIEDEAVLKDFATGALKVTPAHDMVDFEIGQRHGLKIISVIDRNGVLNALAGPGFAGLERFAAREKAVEYLRKNGFLLREEKYTNNVGFSERADVPIEPVLSEQWFLKYPRLSEAKLAVKKNFIHFRPEHWAKTYMHWLENVKDWCISRQLWWGHRIPVWYRKGAERNDSKNWHVSVDGPEDPENWERDGDVLDTWFSSAIWPLATLGWPDEKAMKAIGFDYFYPTAELVTGPDIIFFWVARMIMSGLNLLGEEERQLTSDEIGKRIPFQNVYFTGIIRDSFGRKMSKSLGNSPDPLHLIEKYGADGVRVGLLSMAPSGQDILFAEDRLAQGKKLCTKLWNSFRFRQQNGMEGDRSSLRAIVAAIHVPLLEADDIAILAKFLNLIGEFERAMADYEFNRAVHLLHAFFWSDYCDWYIEISKSRVSGTVLAIHDLLLRQLLLLFHPFIPFVTEELWHGHGYGTKFIGEELLESREQLRTHLSKIHFGEAPLLIEEIASIRELVVAARMLKAQFGLASARDVKLFFRTDAKGKAVIERHLGNIKYLLSTEFFNEIKGIPRLPTRVVALGALFIDMSQSFDIAAEIKRLRKEIKRLSICIELNEMKLNNKDFLARAPAEIIEGARNLLAENFVKLEESRAVFIELSSL